MKREISKIETADFKADVMEKAAKKWGKIKGKQIVGAGKIKHPKQDPIVTYVTEDGAEHVEVEA